MAQAHYLINYEDSHTARVEGINNLQEELSLSSARHMVYLYGVYKAKVRHSFSEEDVSFISKDIDISIAVIYKKRKHSYIIYIS